MPLNSKGLHEYAAGQITVTTLVILPVAAAGGEGGPEEQNAADEYANNSNSNAAVKASKLSSPSGYAQHPDDANKSAEGQYTVA